MAAARVGSRMTLAEVVLAHPETLRVFEAHGLDSCGAGDMTIAAACAGRSGLEPDRLVDALERAIDAAAAGGMLGAELDPGADPRAMGTPELIGRLLERHHAYLRREGPELLAVAGRVARAHGARAPSLLDLERRVRDLVTALELHMDEEEAVLFPAFLRAAERGEPLDAAVARELGAATGEHPALLSALRDIRALAGDYRIPSGACPALARLYSGLRALEADLRRHEQLESEVLFPRFLPRLKEA